MQYLICMHAIYTSVMYSYVQPKTKQQQNVPSFFSSSVSLMLPPFLSYTFIFFNEEWYTREIWRWIGEDMCSNILKLDVLKLTFKCVMKIKKTTHFWYTSKTKILDTPNAIRTPNAWCEGRRSYRLSHNVTQTH
jgi:hypothetical protein